MKWQRKTNENNSARQMTYRSLLIGFYQTSVRETTNFTSARLVIGRQLKLSSDLIHETSPKKEVINEPYVGKLRQNMDPFYELARKHYFCC